MSAAPNGNGAISRGNLTIVLSAAGLIMLAFGAFVKLQSDATDRRMLEAREDVRLVQQVYLKKDEYEEFKKRVDGDVGRLDRQIVPRSENDAHWVANDKDIRVLGERLNEVRGSLAAITTPQSQFTRMESEIAELRKQLNDVAARRTP